MFLKRFFLIVGIILLVQTFVWAEESAPVATEGGDKKFQGFNLQGYTQDGEKSWDIKGETADIVGTQVNLKKVDANAYGDQKMNVTAETGSIDQASGNMRLEKDVVVRSGEGQQLMTNSLDWDKQANEVTTDDNVMITDERITATGTGLKAQPGLKNAQINKDVTVMMNTNSGSSPAKTLTITSDGPMMIDQMKSMAEFNDNVVAIQEDKTLKADRMEVYFDQEQKQIKEIICLGHVVIEQGENKTYADKATYNTKDKKITLSGRPKLILLTEGENAITSAGDKEPR